MRTPRDTTPDPTDFHLERAPAGPRRLTIGDAVRGLCRLADDACLVVHEDDRCFAVRLSEHFELPVDGTETDALHAFLSRIFVLNGAVTRESLHEFALMWPRLAGRPQLAHALAAVHDRLVTSGLALWRLEQAEDGALRATALCRQHASLPLHQSVDAVYALETGEPIAALDGRCVLGWSLCDESKGETTLVAALEMHRTDRGLRWLEDRGIEIPVGATSSFRIVAAGAAETALEAMPSGVSMLGLPAAGEELEMAAVLAVVLMPEQDPTTLITTMLAHADDGERSTRDPACTVSSDELSKRVVDLAQATLDYAPTELTQFRELDFPDVRRRRWRNVVATARSASDVREVVDALRVVRANVLHYAEIESEAMRETVLPIGIATRALGFTPRGELHTTPHVRDVGLRAPLRRLMLPARHPVFAAMSDQAPIGAGLDWARTHAADEEEAVAALESAWEYFRSEMRWLALAAPLLDGDAPCPLDDDGSLYDEFLSAITEVFDPRLRERRLSELHLEPAARGRTARALKQLGHAWNQRAGRVPRVDALPLESATMMAQSGFGPGTLEAVEKGLVRLVRFWRPGTLDAADSEMPVIASPRDFADGLATLTELFEEKL